MYQTVKYDQKKQTRTSKALVHESYKSTKPVAFPKKKSMKLKSIRWIEFNINIHVWNSVYFTNKRQVPDKSLVH